jgi:hypothetical protein
MRASLFVTGLCMAGCGFSVNGSAPPGDGNNLDDGKIIDGSVPNDDVPPVDAQVDAPVDAPMFCYGAGMGAVCLSAQPSQPLVLGNTTFDTSGSSCTQVVTKNNVALCVLAGTTVSLPNGTFSAIGTRPLVVVSTSTMVISGTIDVSSPRGGSVGAGVASAQCGSPGIGETDAGGAGGGAGGSFGGLGGNGGNGDTNNDGGPAGEGAGGVALAKITPAMIRAGCPGANGGDGNEPHGNGGLPGGAVYLIANTSITISGGVRASGGGGSAGRNRSGGGGGGSGGFIGLDTPLVMSSGAITANGGGGGEGGGFEGGFDGADGTSNTTRAGGGWGNTNGGDGGFGSGGTLNNGDPGDEASGGGGGGGGGAGYIYIKGQLSSSGIVSPAAAITP